MANTASSLQEMRSVPFDAELILHSPGKPDLTLDSRDVVLVAHTPNHRGIPASCEHSDLFTVNWGCHVLLSDIHEWKGTYHVELKISGGNNRVLEFCSNNLVFPDAMINPSTGSLKKQATWILKPVTNGVRFITHTSLKISIPPVKKRVKRREASLSLNSALLYIALDHHEYDASRYMEKAIVFAKLRNEKSELVELKRFSVLPPGRWNRNELASLEKKLNETTEKIASLKKRIREEDEEYEEKVETKRRKIDNSERKIVFLTSRLEKLC